MAETELYELGLIDDAALRYVLIAARYKDKWVFCRHTNRNSWELPGGKRNQEESIIRAGERELMEETGAYTFSIKPVCVYSIVKRDVRYGMLLYADIEELLPLSGEFEMAEIQLSNTLPTPLRFPDIQPQLLEYVRKRIES